MNDGIADGNVLAFLDIDGGRVVGVSLRASVGRHKCIGRTGTANVEVLDRNELRQSVGRNVGSSNLDYAAGFVPIVQGGSSGCSVPVDDR